MAVPRAPLSWLWELDESGSMEISDGPGMSKSSGSMLARVDGGLYVTRWTSTPAVLGPATRYRVSLILAHAVHPP